MSLIGDAELAASAGTPWGWIRLALKAIPFVVLAIAGFVILGQRVSIAHKDAALQRANDVMQINRVRIENAMTVQHAADLVNARRVETAQAQANQEVSGEYATNLARAQALAAAYARRLRDGAQAPHGGGGGAGQPGPADAAGTAAGAGVMPVMDDDDFRLCTENTVKAIGWRAWWAKVSAIPR